MKVKLKDNKTREPEKADSQISDGNTVAFAASNISSNRAVPDMNICKIESVHSELDIKDEDPMYESNPTTSHYEQSNYEPPNPQQNYYYMMPQNPGIVSQGAIVQGIASPQTVMQTYYMQPYMMPIPRGKFVPATQQQQQPVYQQQNSQMMMTQPYVSNTNYVSYIPTTTQPQAQYMVAPGPMINQPNPQNPVHYAPRPQNRHNQNNRYAAPQQNSQHPNGAVAKSNNIPVRGSYQRPIKPKNINVPPQRLSGPKRRISQTSSTENTHQKTTSLIVLSDSDDEIEMIVMEKTLTNTTEKATPTNRVKSSEPQRTVNQSRQKPMITSDITVPATKGILSPQIIQRMSQGGISITPVKNNPPPSTCANTQLVVVVNETGSHYALALPNGSKLILTPEQVAQIRASNGGKLIL